MLIQIQVQEVFTYMVQPIRVITIRGKPGIGKTEVSYQAVDVIVSVPRCERRKLQEQYGGVLDRVEGVELLIFHGIAKVPTMGSR